MKTATPELFAQAFRISEDLRIRGWVPRQGRFKYSWEECAKATVETLDLDPRWWIIVYYMQIIHSGLLKTWCLETTTNSFDPEVQ